MAREAAPRAILIVMNGPALFRWLMRPERDHIAVLAVTPDRSCFPALVDELAHRFLFSAATIPEQATCVASLFEFDAAVILGDVPDDRRLQLVEHRPGIAAQILCLDVVDPRIARRVLTRLFPAPTPSCELLDLER